MSIFSSLLNKFNTNKESLVSSEDGSVKTEPVIHSFKWNPCVDYPSIEVSINYKNLSDSSEIHIELVDKLGIFLCSNNTSKSTNQSLYLVNFKPGIPAAALRARKPIYVRFYYMDSLGVKRILKLSNGEYSITIDNPLLYKEFN